MIYPYIFLSYLLLDLFLLVCCFYFCNTFARTCFGLLAPLCHILSRLSPIVLLLLHLNSKFLLRIFYRDFIVFHFDLSSNPNLQTLKYLVGDYFCISSRLANFCMTFIHNLLRVKICFMSKYDIHCIEDNGWFHALRKCGFHQKLVESGHQHSM